MYTDANISWQDIAIDLAGAGVMFTAVFLFQSVWRHFRLASYRSIMILCIATYLFTLFSALTKISFYVSQSVDLSFEFYRLKELSALLFLALLPYFLSTNIRESARLHHFNRALTIAGGSLFLFFGLTAYLFPPTFLFSPFAIQAGGVEAKTGALYLLSQGLLVGILAYTSIVIAIDFFRWKTFRTMWSVQASLFLCLYFNLSAVWKGLFGIYFDPLASIPFSRAVIGQLCLSFGLSYGYLNLFLRQAQEVNRSRNELEAHRNELHALLYTDSLTGLPNRSCFIADLNALLEAGKSAGVLLLDLDNFMEFNECFGDDSGDTILRSVGQALQECMPKGARLYRMGGDEFSAIVTDMNDHGEMVSLAKDIREISAVGFRSGGKNHSFGLAIALVMVPRDGDNTDAVLSNAYSAMHEAKTGNTVCLYSDSMKRDSLLRISTIQRLREDLRGGLFHMVYQPIFDREERISSAEALLRWETKNEDIPVGPDFFIPLLEVAGLMPEMGELVMRLVIRDLGERIRNDATFPLISVNLSPLQLKIGGLGTRITEIFAQSRIPLNRIQFEVTESAFLDNAGVGVENLSYLRSQGSLIAMDDFGTGYSNLGYLRNLPIDKIKVDKSFIKAVPGDAAAESLLKAVSSIGRSFHQRLVAEGVETEAQKNFAIETGFDEIQGFFYSPGVPCAEFLRLIDRERAERDPTANPATR